MVVAVMVVVVIPAWEDRMMRYHARDIMPGISFPSWSETSESEAVDGLLPRNEKPPTV